MAYRIEKDWKMNDIYFKQIFTVGDSNDNTLLTIQPKNKAQSTQKVLNLQLKDGLRLNNLHQFV